jgi:hypothetical protein
MLAARLMTWNTPLDDLQAQVELLGASIYSQGRDGRDGPKAQAAQADAAVAILNETQQYMAEGARAILQETEAND